MTDINKLLDEIEKLPFGCGVSIVHDFVQDTTFRTQNLQALVSEYRKQSQQIREAVEALEAAKSAINGLADQQAMSDDHYLSDLAKVESALSKLKKSE